MDKTAIYILLTVLKIVIIITGFVFIILNFVAWMSTKNSNKIRKAGLLLLGVFLSILLLTAIEFYIA